MVLVLNKGASKAEIEEVNKLLDNLLPKKKLDAKKYCGVIQLKDDPVEIQKQLRDEWE